MDYLEGELPQEEEVGFRRHLAQCSDCVSFFETYRKTPELSREALSAQIPVSVKESVRSFLASRGINPNRMRTISYGKERPVAVCNDASCWTQNRRAVTVLNGGSS